MLNRINISIFFFFIGTLHNSYQILAHRYKLKAKMLETYGNMKCTYNFENSSLRLIINGKWKYPNRSRNIC